LNVLIIRSGALGDTLLMLPSVSGLAPGVKVTFVGREPGLRYLRDRVDRCLDFEQGGWYRLFAPFPDRLGISFPEADVVVGFFSDPTMRKNLEQVFPGSPVYVFPPAPGKGKNVHVAQYLGKCLRSAGLPLDPEASVPAAQREGLLDGQAGARQDRIVLHPGSGAERKNHPSDFWLSLLEGLLKNTTDSRIRPTVLLGPAETHMFSLFEPYLSSRRVGVDVCPDQMQLKEILGEATAYVGHDSGVTHLAAMLGTRTYALMKGTQTEQWHPLGPRVTVLEETRPDCLLEVLQGILRNLCGLQR